MTEYKNASPGDTDWLARLAEARKRCEDHEKAHRKGPNSWDPWDSEESKKEAKRLGEAYLLLKGEGFERANAWCRGVDYDISGAENG